MDPDNCRHLPERTRCHQTFRCSNLDSTHRPHSSTRLLLAITNKTPTVTSMSYTTRDNSHTQQTCSLNCLLLLGDKFSLRVPHRCWLRLMAITEVKVWACFLTQTQHRSCRQWTWDTDQTLDCTPTLQNLCQTSTTNTDTLDRVEAMYRLDGRTLTTINTKIRTTVTNTNTKNLNNKDHRLLPCTVTVHQSFRITRLTSRRTSRLWVRGTMGCQHRRHPGNNTSRTLLLCKPSSVNTPHPNTHLLPAWYTAVDRTRNTRPRLHTREATTTLPMACITEA